MRSNIKRAALSLALSFLAGCIVNIPEQEGKRPANADMPADLAKDSSQDLDPDMVKPGEPVRIKAPATFTVSVSTPRPLAELMAFAVDAMEIPDANVPLSYKAADDAPFTLSMADQTIIGALPGKGALEISSPGLETVSVEVQVIETKMLELPPTIYLNVNQDLTLMDLSRGITAQDERDLLQFTVENDQIAVINGGSIRGLMRGETKLTATLLHLSQEIRVVVRKPVDQLLISPPMLRLLSNDTQGDQLKEASFEVVSLDEDGLVRELAPDETLCDMEDFKMVNDPSWSIVDDLETSSSGTNQYKLKFKKDVVGFGTLELGCLVEGSPQNTSALVEVVLDKQVAAGGAHSCATKDNGNGAPLLQCWGSNELSAMGLKRESEVLGALANSIVDNYGFNGPIWRVDAGRYATCVVNLLGGVDCAGAPLMRARDKFYKVELPQGVLATDVSVGVAHACAVSQDGALYCWGDNSFGQLGQGDTMPKLLPTNNDGDTLPEAVQVDATRKWARVSAGAQHTCALDVYGQAFCWGDNGFGRLGDDSVEARLSPVAVSAPNETLRFVSIAAADTSTCAVERSGSVYCWGQNHQGRLGQAPGPLSFSSPQLVSGGALTGRFALDIDASAGSTCALVRKSGEKISPVCWGENAKGQLGRPASTAQITPELFQSPPSKHTLDLAMGAEHGCLTLQGEAAPRCWGARQNNRLGDDENGFNELFQSVNLPEGIADASFQSNHGCVALDSRKGSTLLDSNVICWGLNSYKQANNLPSFTVGNPTNTPSLQLSPSLEPGERPKDQKLTKIFTGPSHSCGLDDDGVALCWGGNWAGQANPKTTETQLIMAGVSPSAKFSQLALGQGFTCGIVRDGVDKAKIACWGSNELGRLGNNNMAACPDADAACGVKGDQGAPLNANLTFSHIAAATATTCAIGKLDTELGIYCWGAKVAKDATKVEQANTAVKVWSETGLKAFALAAGDAHFCALIGPEAVPSPSQLLCWGDNSFGEVTGGAAPWVHLPTDVLGVNVNNISSMALGSDHTCTLRTNGELSCWGRNNVNQLNDTTQPFSRKPSDRPNAPTFLDGTRPNIVRLLGGASSTCVQTATRIYCAGDNAYRQLGGNPPGDIAPTPELVKNF